MQQVRNYLMLLLFFVNIKSVYNLGGFIQVIYLQQSYVMLIKNKNQLISHYNDIEDSHTYYLINIQKCYQNAISLNYSKKVSSVNRCKYCKAFPFQVNHKNKSNDKEQESIKQIHRKSPKTILKRQSQQQKQRNFLQCVLCESISQRQLKLDLNQEQQTLRQLVDEPGLLTSYLINFEPNQNKYQNTKDLQYYFDYQIRLIFFLDLSLSISILEHFKNVILQVYQGFIAQNNKKNNDNSKLYSIALFLLIDGKIHILQISNIQKDFQIICLQSFLSEKEQFTQLLQTCLFECNDSNLQIFQELIDILIQQKCQGKYKNYSLDGGRYFLQILKSIKNDNSALNYYMPIWIGKIPPISYTQNSIGISASKNIQTTLFLFYQSSNKNKKLKNKQKINQKQSDPYGKNMYDAYEFNLSIKNQLQIISDNNQVYFLEDTEQNNEFYYKFYKVFQIYENIKLFNSKIQIKSDSKYAPKILTKHHCIFYMEENHYFLVKSDNNSNNNKFQISIQFEDIKQKKKLLLINWTTKNLKLMDRFVQIYSCIQQTVKYVFSQFFILKRKGQNKKQSQGIYSVKTIDANRLSIFLSDYMVKSTKNDQNQIIHDIYQFFLNHKRTPFYILNFLSCFESFFNVYKIYPIVFDKIVYWVDGYNETEQEIQNDEQDQSKDQEKEQITPDQIVQRLNEYCQTFYSQKNQSLPLYYELQLKEQGKYFVFK